MRNYFLSISILSGTIIGGGMFAIPYVISKAGILSLFIYLPFLVFVQFVLHSLYAEIILSTKQKHRMPGYVGLYCKNKAVKDITLFISIVGKHGALLAYILLGGEFLYALLNPYWGGSIFLYSITLFLLESIVVLFGLKLIARVELFLSFFLVFLVAIIGFKSFGYFSVNNFIIFDKNYAFLPYGVIFFAVGGQAAIPEVCRLLNRRKEKIKSAIFWGTFLPAILMTIFVIIVVGVTGNVTSPESLVGLKLFFNSGVVMFSLILGLLTIITSFLVISQSLREVYWWDLKMNRKFSWLVACGVPLLIYLCLHFIGVNNLITKVMSLTGAVTGGIFGFILILLLFRVRKVREITPPLNTGLSRGVAILFSSMFILGLIYELWFFFN
ncbi:hypothetical protein K8R62_01585 [bacterium]|nr:hypothetical protein [bacterium]